MKSEILKNKITKSKSLQNFKVEKPKEIEHFFPVPNTPIGRNNQVEKSGFPTIPETPEPIAENKKIKKKTLIEDRTRDDEVINDLFNGLTNEAHEYE